jgi:hypothetical protein
MNSSKPGAEKINSAWITSLPTLTAEIQRIDGNEHGGVTAHLSHHAAQSYLCQSHFAGRGSRPRRDGDEVLFFLQAGDLLFRKPDAMSRHFADQLSG